MKRAKEQYDDLVARIRSGKDAVFGEMEQVFAQAFLERYLKRQSAERKKATHLDEYEKEERPTLPRLNERQKLKLDLDATRAVVGTLGIRPPLTLLSDYTTQAFEEQDWNLLDDTIALSQEGCLAPAALEQVALDYLKNEDYGAAHAVEELLGPITFTPDSVNAVYENLLPDRSNIDNALRISKITQIPIPSKAVQETYIELLDIHNGDLEVDSEYVAGDIFDERVKINSHLRDATGVEPRLTQKGKEHLKEIAEKCELGVQDVAWLNDWYGINDNAKLTRVLQRKALQAKRDQTFKHLYDAATLKIPEKDVRADYKKRAEEKDYHGIARLVNFDLGVFPTQPTMQAVFYHFAKKRKYAEVAELAEKTQIKPHWTREQRATILEQLKYAPVGHRIEHLEQGLSMLTLGAQIPQGKIAQVVVEVLTNKIGYSQNFETEQEKGKAILAEHNVDPSYMGEVEAAVMWYEGSRQLEQENTPHPIYDTTTEFKNYASKVRRAVRELANKSKKIERKPEAYTPLQKLYRTVLFTGMVTAEVGDKRFPKLKELQRATSIPIGQYSIEKAVEDYIQDSSFYHAEAVGKYLKATIGTLPESSAEQILRRCQPQQYQDRETFERTVLKMKAVLGYIPQSAKHKLEELCQE